MGVPLVLAAFGLRRAWHRDGGLRLGLQLRPARRPARGAAQMIAYEVCLASALAGAPLPLRHPRFLSRPCCGRSRTAGGIAVQPLAFILFLTAGAAVTKRIPFDLPEGESEIVGYHVEYSGMKFGMFMMTDFFESIVICGVVTALFLGGWAIPGLDLPVHGPRRRDV